MEHFALVDESVAAGQKIDDISNHWDFESWNENLDSFTTVDESGFIVNICGLAENDIIKSGRVFISSKNGLGWYSWRKRWLVLSKTAMVFFKRDPSMLGGDQVNVILGGILLKKSGSVKVRENKKLLTILFPDVLDRKPFTLKTETSADLHEWRIALEHALKKAPISPCSPSILRSFCPFMSVDAIPSVKSQIATSSMSLVLKKADGSPSFLEKALCFLEEFGSKVEGILRISADLGEVQRRIKEFEEGNTEIDAKEDAHVVGDCVKHILRELPFSLVPVRCCNVLVKAYETYQSEAQIDILRRAIFNKLPEPNRLLFQRILKTMYTISNTPENRMTPSALAACMAPLLLRPILDGECNLIDDTEFIDEDCSQILGVAIAAKTAQAIIALILEEYHKIFSVENSNGYSISVDSEEDLSNEESIDDYYELSSNEELRRSSSFCGSDQYDEMDFTSNLRLYGSYDFPPLESGGSQVRKSLDQYDKGKKKQVKMFSRKSPSPNRKSNRSVSQLFSQLMPISPLPDAETCPENSFEEPKKSFVNRTTTSLWERDSAKKISSTESLNLTGMKRQLEKKKIDLQQNLREEAKVNASLQGSLEQRKQPLIELYLRLNEHVDELQEQLQTENSLPLMSKIGLSQFMSSNKLPNQEPMTREEADEITISEANIAGLDQEDAEVPHHLSLLQHLCGSSSSDAPDTYPHIQSATLESLLFDTTLTFQETLQELSIQPDIRPPMKPKVASVTPSKMKKSPTRTPEEHRPGTMSIVTSFSSSGFDKI